VRGHLEGLDTPHPLGLTLPALFQDDDLTLRLVAGLDEVLAPVFLTLDSQDAYIDPALAPADFLEWIASWVGAELDESWPTDRKRQLVRDLVSLYRARGTVTGLRGLHGRSRQAPRCRARRRRA
jgi:phage tail-like protein